MQKYILFIILLTSAHLVASDAPEKFDKKIIETEKSLHVTLNAQVVHIHFHQNQNNIDINTHKGIWFTPKATAIAQFKHNFNQYRRFKPWRRSKL